jgi:hypothetical protein
VQTSGDLDPHARSRRWQLVNPQVESAGVVIVATGGAAPPGAGEMQPATISVRMAVHAAAAEKEIFIGIPQDRQLL